MTIQTIWLSKFLFLLYIVLCCAFFHNFRSVLFRQKKAATLPFLLKSPTFPGQAVIWDPSLLWPSASALVNLGLEEVLDQCKIFTDSNKNLWRRHYQLTVTLVVITLREKLDARHINHGKFAIQKINCRIFGTLFMVALIDLVQAKVVSLLFLL